MNVKRKRAGNVRLSDHAYERWKLRVSSYARKSEVANRIKARIAAELKNGAEVNQNGALEIKIMPGVWAICYPSFMGGWEVATIIKEGWKEDMEESENGACNGECESECGCNRSHRLYGQTGEVIALRGKHKKPVKIHRMENGAIYLIEEPPGSGMYYLPLVKNGKNVDVFEIVRDEQLVLIRR